MGAPRPAINALLASQRARWEAGDRVSIERLLAGEPAPPDVVLDLIYAEVILRREFGERPGADEYVARFPAHASDIRDQFEVDAALVGRATVEMGSTGAYVPVAAPAAPAGYEVLGEVGRGGMGVVYRARHVRLDRVVALKMIRSGELADPAERARFAAEAQAVARLSHPNIVQIFEVGEANGAPFLALEYVPGGNLADALTGPVDPKPAAALVAALARGVHHAHQNGIVHRDLKPANVLLDTREPEARLRTGDTSKTGEGREYISFVVSAVACLVSPKIADFGLAKRLEADGPTRTGDFLGTPNYAAPEQATGGDVGPAADVHALGGILYHLLTGRPPFSGATALETLDQVRFAEPVAPSRLRPNLPRDLEIIALACLRKDPGKRYASAAALADDLDRFLAGDHIQARPVGVIERALKWCRRRPAVAALAASLIVLTAAALITVTALWQGEAAAQRGERMERTRAETRTFELLLANARLAWLAGDLPQVRATLAECPLAYRGPDWEYLDRVSAPPLMDVTAGEAVQRLAFSRDGRHLAAVSSNGRARVWDTATGRPPVESEPVFRTVYGAAFTADGLVLVAAEGSPPPPVGREQPGAFEVTVLDPRTSGVHASWRVDDRPARIILSPDGKYLAYTVYKSGKVHLHDGMTGVRLHTLPCPEPGQLTFSFTPAGDQFVVQGNRPNVFVYDPATGAEVRLLAAPDGFNVVSNGVHPDGRRMVSRGPTRDRKSVAAIFDLAVPGSAVELGGEFWVVNEVRFSPDGRWVAATGHIDRWVVVMDAGTGKEYLPLRGPGERVAAFEFSPDGRRLAVAVRGGRVTLWDLKMESHGTNP